VVTTSDQKATDILDLMKWVDKRNIHCICEKKGAVENSYFLSTTIKNKEKVFDGQQQCVTKLPTATHLPLQFRNSKELFFFVAG
jgi:hypothetical protein